VWENKALVESFIRAFTKSVKYELANPEEVAGFIGDYVGTTETPEQLLPQIQNNAKQILGITDGRQADIEAAGLGYVPIESAASAQQVFLDAGIMTTEVDTAPLFTNELVEKYKDWGDS
jgi:ABC-type nitrate/sulfonate/bicarbonate transport system substrate-binding protein